jgi:altronate hydrolase
MNAKDNVAVATRAIDQGEAVLVDGTRLIEASESVKPGHKVALQPIAVGENVYRYGEPIVEAIRAIEQGEWVHVHNTRPIPRHLEERGDA